MYYRRVQFISARNLWGTAPHGFINYTLVTAALLHVICSTIPVPRNDLIWYINSITCAIDGYERKIYIIMKSSLVFVNMYLLWLILIISTQSCVLLSFTSHSGCCEEKQSSVGCATPIRDRFLDFCAWNSSGKELYRQKHIKWNTVLYTFICIYVYK